MEDCILNLQKAVQLTDDGHPNKAAYLSNLGGSQRVRFDRLGRLTDLEHSISNLNKAVQLTDDGHPDKAVYLSSLGSSQKASL